MTFGFLNALMLAGLATVALPVIAHLISKRKFDVVLWGAMRFLELGQRTRRRIRIQDLLLLLLRMGLLACVVLALARPWGKGSLLGALSADVVHDYVFVLDGSTSMAWQGEARTPHSQAVQWVFDALEELHPGDTVSLVDARGRSRRVIFPPTSDWRRVREELAALPEPTGTSRLPIAIEDSLKMLSTTANLSRRIIVLSDDQASAWQPTDEFAWERVDDLRRQTQVMPVIDVVTFGARSGNRSNDSVGRIELSRDVTVPEFPVKVRAAIRQSGGLQPVQKKVHFEIDGQRLAEKTLEVSLLPGGEALVEFDHAFPAEGNFVASIVLDPDELPRDDRADAVVAIATGLPVLLVDGDIRVDQTRSETFYARSVFAASGVRSPWIQASVIGPEALDDTALAGQKAVFLCNVSKLTSRQWESVRAFVRDGGGLVIAPGDKVQADSWNEVAAELPHLLPATFRAIEQEDRAQPDSAAIFDSASLEVPWLRRFRQEDGVDFWQTRMWKWWKLEPLLPEPPSGDPPQRLEEEEEKPLGSQVLARSSSGLPLLVSRTYENGRVLQLAFPLDADWSTLPAKNDFVPFLHELVFMLAASGYQRNVNVGDPLFLPLDGSQAAEDFVVSGPGVKDAPAEVSQHGRNAFAMFRQTTVPGIYRFHQRNGKASAPQPFVVDDDRSESDLTPLTEEQWELLAKDGRLHRVQTMRDIRAASQQEAPRAELWWLLLVLVLGMLVCEVALMRKMVQGGHAALDAAEAA